MATTIQFKRGNLADYNLLTKDPGTLYFVEDIGKIYRGSVDVTNAFVVLSTSAYNALTTSNAVTGVFYIDYETCRIKIRNVYTAAGVAHDEIIELYPGVLPDGATYDEHTTQLITAGQVKAALDDIVINIETLAQITPNNKVIVTNGQDASGNTRLADSGYNLGNGTIEEAAAGSQTPASDTTLATEAGVVDAINRAFSWQSF